MADDGPVYGPAKPSIDMRLRIQRQQAEAQAAAGAEADKSDSQDGLEGASSDEDESGSESEDGSEGESESEGEDEDEKGGKDAEPAVETASAAANAANTLKTFPTRMSVVSSSIQQTVSLLQSMSYLLAILLVIFVIHQLFLWVDSDPEIAFDRAALVFEAVEVTYDTSGLLINAGVDVLNAAVIPLWNSASYYIVEPIVILVLELFMLVFTQQHYTGVYSEDDFAYIGLDCTASEAAATWCGRFGAYQARLEAAEKAPYYVNESDTYEARRRIYDSAEQETYVFGISTARRLSTLAEDAGVAPAFEMTEIVESLDSFAEMFITLGALLSDLFMGVGYVAGSSSFSVIVDGLMSLLKGVFGGIRWLVKSGLFTTVRVNAHTLEHAHQSHTHSDGFPVRSARAARAAHQHRRRVPGHHDHRARHPGHLRRRRPAHVRARPVPSRRLEGAVRLRCAQTASNDRLARADRRPRAQSKRSASRAPTPAATSSSSPPYP